ncbi:glycine betaine ABC transporter substrate-binding protein, partial [Moorena sp. SIO3I6]|uniref:glycine betaine ABC transporter substrate-binding protein n=1 Tax=Moorena sp. SIO3I6 TaxID=2607831 RepID=UPI0013F8217F
FAIDRIRIVANKKFVSANPAAKRLFELIHIPVQDINAQNELLNKGEDSSKDIRRHAEEWIENHQDLFDSWVEEARNV